MSRQIFDDAPDHDVWRADPNPPISNRLPSQGGSAYPVAAICRSEPFGVDQWDGTPPT